MHILYYVKLLYYIKICIYYIELVYQNIHILCYFKLVYYMKIYIHYTHTFIFYYILFFLWRCGPTRAMASSFTTFLDHTQRRITVCRIPLDE